MAERPALADVLAGLSECPIDTVRQWLRACEKQRMRPSVETAESGMAGLCVRGYFADGTRGWLFPLRDLTPIEAMEVLAERALWPWATEGEHAARWWCPTCAGRGCVGGVWVGENYVDADVCDVCSVEDMNATGGYAVRGWLAGPLLPCHLVAVASLGVDTLARVEEIVRETWPRATLVWRVADAGTLREHHKDHCAGTDVTPALVFSREMTPPLTNFEWRPAWPEVCPYGGMFGAPDDDRHGVHRAWPSLRALATMGLHLLSLDSDRIVLGVEALS